MEDDFVNTIRKQVEFKFFKLVADGNWSYPMLIKRSKIELNDSLLSIGFLLTEEIGSFSIE